MPRGDGTGPMGAGPMTGRAAGYCAGFQVPGFANNAVGAGCGLGMGRGRGFATGGRGRGLGFRNRYAANYNTAATFPQPVMTEEQEKEYLSNEITALENQLKAAKEKVKELKN